jgi:phage shock protein C
VAGSGAGSTRANGSGGCLGIAAYGGFRVDTGVRTVVLLLTLRGLLAVAYQVLPLVPTVTDYERQRDAPRYT